MCLPEATLNVFQTVTISQQEANILWETLRQITDEFNRNAEKFYAAFYGLLVENIFPLKFDITSTNILMSEVANHILIYLSDINIDTTAGSLEVMSSQKNKLNVSNIPVTTLYINFTINFDSVKVPPMIIIDSE